MEIRLNLPRGERQQEFVDQLNAALRAISSGSSGSARFLPDGSFEASISSTYRFKPDLECSLTWTFLTTSDGVLSKVSVDSPGPNPQSVWEQAAHDIVTSALAATVAGVRKRFFQRASFAYIGPALDGEYWLPDFRLAAAIGDDTEPVGPFVERWVDIDMNVDAIDQTHAAAIAGERARRIAARLSLLLDVGLERPPFEFRWVMVRTSADTFENMRCQMMFQPTEPQPTTMPKKGVLRPLGKFRNDFPLFPGLERLNVPQAARGILRGVNAKPHPIGDAFDRCARLYQVGLVVGKAYPSALLAYAIAAVESITQLDRRYEGFSDFMRRHLPEDDEITGPFLDFLYRRVRSAHFHAGEFPLGEFGPFRTDALMDPQRIEASRLRFAGVAKVRAAILDWCLKQVAVDSEA